MIDAVELTRELVRTDSINPTSTERACADRIGALLEKAGFSTSRFEYAPGHTSLVARRGGGDKPALCFTGRPSRPRRNGQGGLERQRLRTLSCAASGRRRWTDTPFTQVITPRPATIT